MRGPVTRSKMISVIWTLLRPIARCNILYLCPNISSLVKVFALCAESEQTHLKVKLGVLICFLTWRNAEKVCLQICSVPSRFPKLFLTNYRCQDTQATFCHKTPDGSKYSTIPTDKLFYYPALLDPPETLAEQNKKKRTKQRLLHNSSLSITGTREIVLVSKSCTKLLPRREKLADRSKQMLQIQMQPSHNIVQIHFATSKRSCCSGATNR